MKQDKHIRQDMASVKGGETGIVQLSVCLEPYLELE